MPGTILVSGFERFGNRNVPNLSSEVLLPHLEGTRGNYIDTITLPVEHDGAAAVMIGRIAATQPEAVVMFGMSLPDDPVLVEWFAHNLTNDKPDNSGACREGKIVADGPLCIESTLPLPEIEAGLRQEGIPFASSFNARQFVCNRLFYLTGFHTRYLGIPSGLIHIGSGLEHSTVRRAGTTIIDAVMSSLVKRNEQERAEDFHGAPRAMHLI